MPPLADPSPRPRDPSPPFPLGIKICGLTRPEEAAACADLGADAIGLIFYPPSPRFVDPQTAAAICAVLPPRVARVGVFVDVAVEEIRAAVRRCGLTGVQLHGAEPPAAVAALRRERVLVVKALFAARPPNLDAAAAYDADAFLVECGRGRLPGGNAEAWRWAEARPVAVRGPLILAGGLSPENVAEAVRAAAPDAVDVSSGVESAPGRKDLARVAALIRVARADPPAGIRPVFQRQG